MSVFDNTSDPEFFKEFVQIFTIAETRKYLRDLERKQLTWPWVSHETELLDRDVYALRRYLKANV